MLFRRGLWLLIVACVGALDYYEDERREDYKNEVMYHDDSDNELNYLKLPEKISLNDLKTFKIIKSIQDRISLEPNRYRAIFAEENRWLDGPKSYSDEQFKGAVVKRLDTKPDANVVIVKPVSQQQRKWRIKRPPGLCLLKLCGPLFKYIYE